MKVGLGQQPSFVWHSILVTKGLFQMGSSWHVENGCSISICDDAWLLGSRPYKINIDHVSGIGRVVDLIDVDRGE